MATLEQLLQSVFPNARGEMEDTPLHVAITRGNAELATLLLSHGADPELRSAFGSARELAAQSGGAVAALFGHGG